jgi:glycosyltransferase involved in cell wall biosynthesis
MTNTSIGIVVPCYNASTYIQRLSLALSRLNPAPSQILLVDDSSTDKTFDLALKANLPIIQTACNLGPGGARQYAMDYLTTDWVHFLDADDDIDPSYISTVLPHLNANIDVLLHSADWIDEQSGKLLEHWSFADDYFSSEPLSATFIHPVPFHCSVLRTSSIISAGGIVSTYRCWEDGDLHLRLAANGARFTSISDTLSYSYRHSRGASSNHSYCHDCRMAMIKSYCANRTVPSNLLLDEAIRLGDLYFGERMIRKSYSAYKFANSLGRPIIDTKQKLLRHLGCFLPYPITRMIQQSIRAISSSREVFSS